MIINGAKFNMPVLQNSGIPRKNSEDQKVGTNFGGMANRFDRFILNNIIKECTDSETDGLTEIKKMLTSANTEDKQTDLGTALEAYSLMQNLLQGEIRGAEGEIEWFNKLSEEKKYYQGLLNSTEGDKITVNGGRYLLSGVQDGEMVSRADIEAAVSYVENKISDDLLCRRYYYIGEDALGLHEGGTGHYNEDGTVHLDIPDTSSMVPDEQLSETFRSAGQKYYNGLAEVFAKATGIEICFADVEGKLFGTEVYTEENFIEKTLERIEALKDTSQNLKDTMCDWLETQINETLITIENTGIDIGALLETRKNLSDFDLLKTLSEENESQNKNKL